MSKLMSFCPRKSCGYSTNGVFNYCPVCSCPMMIFDKKSKANHMFAAAIIEENEPCRAFFLCHSRSATGPGCKEPAFSHRCIENLFSMLESIELDLRVLRRSLGESGIKVQRPQTSDIRWSPTIDPDGNKGCP